MAKASSVSDSWLKELECTICSEQYKEPKVLPCLHSFCKTCLEGLLPREGLSWRVDCPSCRSSIEVSLVKCVAEFVTFWLKVFWFPLETCSTQAPLRQLWDYYVDSKEVNRWKLWILISISLSVVNLDHKFFVIDLRWGFCFVWLTVWSVWCPVSGAIIVGGNL